MILKHIREETKGILIMSLHSILISAGGESSLFWFSLKDLYCRYHHICHSDQEHHFFSIYYAF